ncbi:MAG: TRAP transporter large permease [Lachnospiraceae bacterium]|nr:TRAP transporter large permease [Lachnospiraceae bacterium]
MSTMAIGFIGLGIMLVLLFLGTSLSFTFALSGLIGIIMLLGFDKASASLMSTPFTQATTYSYIVMPLFMLMGDIAFDGKLTEDAYTVAKKWLGHLPGGLAVTSTVASAIFGAVCGSGSTTAMVMSRVSWPEMKKAGYKPSFGLGAIAAAGPIGILIPPSTPLIIYGILSNTSVAALFMAGWLPGLLLTLAICVTTVIMALIYPKRAPRSDKTTMKEKLRSMVNVIPFAILIIVVMGGIWLGICTVNEGAAIGVCGALIIVIAMRRMKGKKLLETLKNVCGNGSSLFYMFVGMAFFQTFMTLSGLPKALANWVGGLNVGPYVIIWCIVLLYLFLGCFLDSPPVMLLTTAILAEVVSSLGFSLVWFGIVVTFTCAIGALSPPVGINLFVIRNTVPDVSINEIIKGVIPYICVIFAVLIVIMYVPQISLLLPSLM